MPPVFLSLHVHAHLSAFWRRPALNDSHTVKPDTTIPWTLCGTGSRPTSFPAATLVRLLTCSLQTRPVFKPVSGSSQLQRRSSSPPARPTICLSVTSSRRTILVIFSGISEDSAHTIPLPDYLLTRHLGVLKIKRLQPSVSAGTVRYRSRTPQVHMSCAFFTVTCIL